MSVEEELHEHAEHAKEPFDKKVAVTMAIIAALLAMVSVLGHVLSNEEILAQQKASDQWAFYQAKDIRRYDSEIAQDVLKAVKGADMEKAIEHYSSNAEKYDKDREGIRDKATEYEKERDHTGNQATRLEFGEVFLEIAIVLASLAILSKRPLVWYSSMIAALAGVGLAATTMFVP
ncbi:MAG TPA: DUF4337 domain-containing protein [Bryobacteraceae bacterium]|jgi:hypothetical protein